MSKPAHILEKEGVLVPFPRRGIAQNKEIRIDGPLSGPMVERVRKLKSNYQSTFDWSVYDRLYNKFGQNQPRGGVLFKTLLKLVNYHPACSKCHYALEIDTYGRGCVHNCKYCYAKDQLTLRGYWNNPHPMPIDLTEVRKVFHTVFETDKKSKWREILSRRVPLRIGSMSDSFMWMDQKYKVSLEFLKILKFYRYPYIVFTRSDLIAEEEYLEAIDSRLASIQFSISGDNEVITRQIEPGAPSFSRRIQALRRLADAGIWTTVRINPLFPTYPDGYFTAKASVQERFDGEIPKFPLLDISQADKFMSQLASAKVPSIVVGFVRLNQTAISQLSKATNVDLRKFFYPDNYRSSGESRYSDAEIGHYYNLLRQSSQKYSIRFSTCYIGNGIKDYFQYQQLWTQKKDCCDAVGNVEAFTQTAQSVTWEERTRHASCKETVNVAKKQENQFDQIFSGEKERISAEKTSSSSYSSLGKPFKWQGRNRESSFQD